MYINLGVKVAGSVSSFSCPELSTGADCAAAR